MHTMYHRPSCIYQVITMRVVGFLVSLLVFFIQVPAQAATENCEQEQCVAVVDVGSTGSRLHIYSYDLDKNNSAVAITERWAKKIKPGLATLEASRESIDAYLNILLADSPKKHLPIYFYATAGMRLLPKPKQQQFHAFVQEWFNNQADWQLINSKTITGSEEGLFGWLSINYQLGNLTKDDASIGVLDMGGASVQVVFPVKNDADISEQNIQKIDVYGHNFTLFVHSFLGLGQTEVSHQFLESPACFITNYEMPTGEFAAGDAYACENEVASLMNAVHRVNNVVQTTLNANPVNDWFVMGGLQDLVKSPPFNISNGEFTSQDLLEKANTDICHQQWSTLNSQYPTNDYLYGYCLFPSYYYALIVDGYGIQPQEKLKYMGANQNSDWTIGVIIKESNNLAV